jgi:glucose/arabinose dehydrogenase
MERMRIVLLSVAILTSPVVAGIGGVHFHAINPASAQPTLLDPNLQVETVVSGLVQPVALAFIGPDDILVTEKASGQVQRIVNGVVHSTVLDLAVNSASERGLLGIALHPDFPANPGVYLYNTESTTGADTGVLDNTPLLGNRVDRFVWNGSTLTFDHNIIKLRAFQNDRNSVDLMNPQNPPQPLQRGNHDGGVIRFGPDKKLYIIIGDVGRRGWLQNNLMGPMPDDDFGGPEPDNAHLTGVILRLNDDGSTPTDNPFFHVGPHIGADLGGALGAEVSANLQRIFAYGIRNSFGMTFDPQSQALWISENGGRAFDEINRIDPGHNGGWIQVIGPIKRIADYKAIEVAAGIGPTGPAGLQQLRWPATNIADTHQEVRQRLFTLPGSHYRDPEFSWKHVVPPAGLGFIDGPGLGAQYAGDLIVGSAVARPVAQPPSVIANPGHLYRFRLNGGRTKLVFEDERLKDRVADNIGRDDFVTEGEEILFGTDFGIVTDIQTGPDGSLYLVALARGEILKISLAP